MAFAKLSAALLACNDVRPAAPLPPAPLPPEERHRAAPRTDAANTRAQLAQHLGALKLPAFLREHDRVARQCAAEGLGYAGYLLCLTELELAERKRLLVGRRTKEAQFPALKRLESFELAALPRLDKSLVLELAGCQYVGRRENVIAIGNSGTGKTHLAIALGLAACQKGASVSFTTAASLATDLLEARSAHHLSRLQRRLAACNLLIIDELGYMKLPSGGAELLFEVLGQRCERGSTLITSNLPIEQWLKVFGCERLTDALLDRLTHHGHLLDMHGESYRPKTRLPQPALSAGTEAA